MNRLTQLKNQITQTLQGVSANECASKTVSDLELRQHNTAQDLWVKIGDTVYDLTKFASSHPGGAEALVRFAGTDVTDSFQKVGHSALASKMAAKFVVGKYRSPTQEEQGYMTMVDNKDKEIKYMQAQLASQGLSDKLKNKTIYEMIGGAPTMEKFIERFYGYVLNDDRVKHFFKLQNMPKLKKRQNAFISALIGCQTPYFGKDMTTAHIGMNLNDMHFNTIKEIAGKTLKDLGAPDNIITIIANTMETYRQATIHK